MRLLPFLLLATSLYAQVDGSTRNNWPSYGGTTLAWRYSALDQVNTSNVSKLQVAWAFQTGDYEQGLQSTPIVIDGVMYLSTSRSQVFALNAATGSVIWNYKYPLPRGRVNAQNRGVAVADGKVFVGTYDDYLVAIDQKTGHEVWKLAVDDSHQCLPACTINSAPIVAKGKVIIGEAAAAITRSAATSPRSTPKPAASPGASTPFRSRANQATRHGRATPGNLAAEPPG